MFLRIALACLSVSTALAAESPLALTARDEVVLSGIYSAPENTRAIALLLPGSGNVGLDGDVSSPFVGSGYRGARAALSEQIAESLSAAGIASYRYAKRGYENAAELPHQTFPYLLNDAEDALRLLRTTHPETRIVVVGFSEGALLATHLAARTTVDGLFLLGLPSRPIDEIFDYQFIEWPIEVLSRHLDRNHDGLISTDEQIFLTTLPSTGAPLISADSNSDGVLSLADEVAPYYRTAYLHIRGLLSDPSLASWYQGMSSLPPFATVAALVGAPVYLYHGRQDPQVNYIWALSDSRHFTGLQAMRLFEDAGHAFAPLEGVAGEVKTSGPFSETLLTSLVSDIQTMLSR